MKKAAKSKTPVIRIGEPGAVAAFRRAAEQFDRKANRSKRTAHATLVREGILTRSGNLTANYR
jgi:hypothetical protein